MTLILIFICALAQSSAPTKDKVEAVAPATQSANSDTTRAQKDPVDWRKAEGVLSHQMQLTLSERFVKAGEAYFNSDATQIVFQAIEHDAQGNPESEYYSMYVAQLRDGLVVGAGLAQTEPVQISHLV